MYFYENLMVIFFRKIKVLGDYIVLSGYGVFKFVYGFFREL